VGRIALGNRFQGIRVSNQQDSPRDSGEANSSIQRPLSAALQISSSSINVDSAKAQPLRQTRKSMSRRSGQDSQPFKAGKWWRVRVRFDMPGVEDRQHKSLKVCPVALRLSKPEVERMATEVIAASGANSKERFERVVLGEGISFREQAKFYLKDAVSRNRKPLRSVTSIQAALNRWILPEIGDLPLSMVDNGTVQPLVRKMYDGGKGLSARTVCKYTEYIRVIVRSLKHKNGEPVHKRIWDAEALDLPIVEYRKQKRPALKVDGVNALIQASKPGQMRILFVLLAATGMRISEALALETKHFINDGRTIVIEQQVDRNCPRIVPYVKTDASYRQIDLHPDIVNYLLPYVSRKTGLIFHTKNHTPYLYGNLAEDWLDPLLAKLRLDESWMGWHSFRRFRNSWLRSQRCLDDILMHWMAHKPLTMSETYSALKDDLDKRWAEVANIGYGFLLPGEDVPSVPRILMAEGSRKSRANSILVNRMTKRSARSSVG
jgi:integrase